MYQGQQIRLRPFEAEDADLYLEWVNRSDVLFQVDRVLPVTRQQHARWYQEITASELSVVFAIEQAGAFAGCVWLHQLEMRHRKAEVRILLGTQDKGLGPDALNTLALMGFRQLNLHKLYAYVLSSNPRAVAAFEKAGFAREACLRQDRYVDGHYVDVWVLSRFAPENQP